MCIAMLYICIQILHKTGDHVYDFISPAFTSRGIDPTINFIVKIQFLHVSRHFRHC